MGVTGPGLLLAAVLAASVAGKLAAVGGCHSLLPEVLPAGLRVPILVSVSCLELGLASCLLAGVEPRAVAAAATVFFAAGAAMREANARRSARSTNPRGCGCMGALQPDQAKGATWVQPALLAAVASYGLFGPPHGASGLLVSTALVVVGILAVRSEMRFIAETSLRAARSTSARRRAGAHTRVVPITKAISPATLSSVAQHVKLGSQADEWTEAGLRHVVIKARYGHRPVFVDVVSESAGNTEAFVVVSRCEDQVLLWGDAGKVVNYVASADGKINE